MSDKTVVIGEWTERQLAWIDAVEQADIVILVDVLWPAYKSIAYGAHLLSVVASSGLPSDVRILEIVIDYDTDDLEKILAVCRHVKGKHDTPSTA